MSLITLIASFSEYTNKDLACKHIAHLFTELFNVELSESHIETIYAEYETKMENYVFIEYMHINAISLGKVYGDIILNSDINYGIMALNCDFKSIMYTNRNFNLSEQKVSKFADELLYIVANGQTLTSHQGLNFVYNYHHFFLPVLQLCVMQNTKDNYSLDLSKSYLYILDLYVYWAHSLYRNSVITRSEYFDYVTNNDLVQTVSIFLFNYVISKRSYESDTITTLVSEYAFNIITNGFVEQYVNSKYYIPNNYMRKAVCNLILLKDMSYKNFYMDNKELSSSIFEVVVRNCANKLQSTDVNDLRSVGEDIELATYLCDFSLFFIQIEGVKLSGIFIKHVAIQIIKKGRNVALDVVHIQSHFQSTIEYESVNILINYLIEYFKLTHVERMSVFSSVLEALDSTSMDED
jgi:hypothetical protein